MTHRFELLSTSEIDPERREGISSMKEVVYPPALYLDHPVRSREWLPARWAVTVTDPDGRVVSYTGIHESEGSIDRRPARIGGVGGIATHPDSRGLGLARTSIARALEFLREERGVDFALLVCEDRLVDYYTNLGWRLFLGVTIDTQFGEREVFTFNRVMVHDSTQESPREGTIEIFGPLW